MALCNVRKEIYYGGHVQGVGFRQTVHMLAGGYAVTGYVVNLEDGRVKLVAEGELQQIEEFLTAVNVRMTGKIHDMRISRLAATGEFSRFNIVF